ncbi:MAG: peptide chain release factor N(5)-glutamine methyltransferase, partial [Acidimicrobiales bacterium]
AVARLGGGPEARREAGWIVEEVTGERWLGCSPGTGRASPRASARFEDLVGRRAGGEPLQYVLGRWPFRALDLMVDRRVLVPRPETEQVVEVALRELDEVRDATAPPHVVVDLGTGSGAVALSVAAERAGVQVWGTDVSADALDVARSNLCGLGGFAATRVRLVQGEWWAALPAHLAGAVDIVACNPPYVSSGEMGDLDAGVAGWEPRTALEAGPTGLESIGEVLNGAPAWLRPGGRAVLEIAPHQAAAAAGLAREAGFAETQMCPDLAGRDRVLVSRGSS